MIISTFDSAAIYLSRGKVGHQVETAVWSFDQPQSDVSLMQNRPSSLPHTPSVYSQRTSHSHPPTCQEATATANRYKDSG